jgi:hypothetical protein
VGKFSEAPKIHTEEADGDIIHAEGVRVWFHIIRAGGW